MMKVLLLALLLALPAEAAQIAVVNARGVSITLYDEPCKLDVVANLPFRATWTTAQKTFEGCYDINSFGIVVMFFDDLTAVSLPGQAFMPVSET